MIELLYLRPPSWKVPARLIFAGLNSLVALVDLLIEGSLRKAVRYIGAADVTLPLDYN